MECPLSICPEVVQLGLEVYLFPIKYFFKKRHIIFYGNECTEVKKLTLMAVLGRIWKHQTPRGRQKGGQLLRAETQGSKALSESTKCLLCPWVIVKPGIHSAVSELLSAVQTHGGLTVTMAIKAEAARTPGGNGHGLCWCLMVCTSSQMHTEGCLLHMHTSGCPVTPQ